MNLTYNTRSFYPAELRVLKRIKALKEKETGSKLKLFHFIIAGLLGASSAYIASIIPDSFWTFLIGLIAVFCFAFIVFTLYEIYKQKKRHAIFLQKLNLIIEQGTVDTCLIKAKRIAIAPEYEDENDLYIVELNENEVLYLWDKEYNLNKKLPCLDFEIYEESFFTVLGRQVYPLSDKIEPVKIDKKAKWNFMKIFGAADHLTIERINFDKLIEKYNSCI